jgi:uroporphyrin-III C-methyltransferase / precorrin-2 dehydrogenase / sirohydrochlorin ferrochelatase
MKRAPDIATELESVPAPRGRTRHAGPAAGRRSASRTLQWSRSGGGLRKEVTGIVHLVGAGPGDPELLTLKAARLLQQADVCVYDHLVSTDVLRLVRRGADLVYAGKEKSNHALRQEEINALLVGLARRGKRVLRLKGGDPFIFGRGGEEMQFLAAHDVPFEVVPGVTSASGASAYAGIPLTHRDHAQACIFVTGHLKDGTCSLDWKLLARRNQTVVIYMGMGQIEEICRELKAHGLPADWPAAAIERATTPNQHVVTGTLTTLPGRAAHAALKPPALIVVGEVVRLRGELGWFDTESARLITHPEPAHA